MESTQTSNMPKTETINKKKSRKNKKFSYKKFMKKTLKKGSDTLNERHMKSISKSLGGGEFKKINRI